MGTSALEFEKPIVEHPHSDFRSLTGGYVYHGQRLPELKGAYIYGDYDTGKLWLLRYEGDAEGRSGKVTEHRQLADTQIRLVEFAQDAAGEVYFVDFAGGGRDGAIGHRPLRFHAPPAAGVAGMATTATAGRRGPAVAGDRRLVVPRLHGGAQRPAAETRLL